jgi:hypothetical protein
MTCHFIAMVVQALERDPLPDGSRKLAEIPLYPEGRGCPAPSAPRIFSILNGVARRHLINTDGQLLQTFPPELTKLQRP